MFEAMLMISPIRLNLNDRCGHSNDLGLTLGDSFAGVSGNAGLLVVHDQRWITGDVVNAFDRTFVKN